MRRGIATTLAAIALAVAPAVFGSPLGANAAPSSWTVSNIDQDGGFYFGGISCTSSAFCMAVDDQGNAFRYDGTGWTETNIDGTTALESVSCGSPTFCVAGDRATRALIYNGSTWSTPHNIDPGGNGRIWSISCVSNGFCAAGDDGGEVITYNGAAWSAPYTLDTVYYGSVFGVSCVSRYFCMAVDQNGNEYTWDGSSWLRAGGNSSLYFYDVSCAAIDYCVGVDYAGRVEAYNAGVFYGPTQLDATNPNASLSGVSCWAPYECIAIDPYGNAWVYDGLASATWSKQTIDPGISPGAGLAAISCPSSNFCAAVDGAGNVIIGSASATFGFTLDEAGLPGGVPHQASFDGGLVNLPFSTEVGGQTTHSFAYPSPVNAGPGTRYVTTDSGGTVVVNANFSDSAVYTAQYRLTTGTSPTGLAASDTSLTPSAWFSGGDTLGVTTDPVIGVDAGDRYRFDHWSGDVNGSANPGFVDMAGPRTAIANYVLQHLLTIGASGLPGGVTWQVTVDGATSYGPFSGWIDDGSPLTLSAQQLVLDSFGTVYFFNGFSPAPPSSLTAPLATNAEYETMAQILSGALSGGGIYGAGAGGIENSFSQQWAAAQAAIAAGDTSSALADLQSFICHVQALTGKKVAPSTSTALISDATVEYESLSGGTPPGAC